MSIQPLLHWLFGPHMFDVGAVLCISIGLGLALSTDPRDIAASQWFFGIAAILAMGRAGHWLVTEDSLPLPKPVLAAVLFGVIGSLWITTYSWAHGKLPPTEVKANDTDKHQDTKDTNDKVESPPYVTEQFKIEQRAQIGVISVSLLEAKVGGSIVTLIRMKNSGKSAASRVRFAMRCTSGSPESVLQEAVAQFMSERTYDPGEAVHPAAAVFNSQPTSRDRMTQEEVNDFESGKIPTYVYGRIYYVDIFGDRHLTKFCSRWQRGSFGFCSKYNEMTQGPLVPTPLDVAAANIPAGLSAPRLIGRFLTFNVVQDNTGGFLNSDVYVKVQIENLGGTPSTAKFFNMTARRDSKSVRGQLMVLPESFTLFQKGIAVGTLRAEESLDEQAAHPIIRGTPIEGWLKFRFPSLPLEEALDMSWEITFIDNEGKLTQMVGESKGEAPPQFPPPDPTAKPPAY